MNINRHKRVFAIVIAGVALAGCTPAVNGKLVKSLQKESASAPYVTPVSSTQRDLRNLPAPSFRHTVAVYSFTDQTGQMKENANFQTLSRAVTQGGTSLLISALLDAGNQSWFSVLDRAKLNDILKERQILVEMRRRYLGADTINPKILPPLKTANIIIAGGVIGYDTNVVTGGAGARYLGIGVDKKYIVNTVTVQMRVVSVRTGRVLATVETSKKIASFSLAGNIFKFVGFNQLLEATTGVTTNEPKLMALQQAIEKGVRSLVIEAARRGVWKFRSAAAGRKLIREYEREKNGIISQPKPLAKAKVKVKAKAKVKKATKKGLVVSRAKSAPSAVLVTSRYSAPKAALSAVPSRKTKDVGAVPPRGLASAAAPFGQNIFTNGRLVLSTPS